MDVKLRAERLFSNRFFIASVVGTVLCSAASLILTVWGIFATGTPISAQKIVRAYISAMPFALLGFICGLIAFYSFLRSVGANKVVVWLRRFHQHEPSRFPFPTFFTQLGSGAFQVVTIQDTQFQFSFMVGATRSMLLIIGIQVLLVLPFFWLGFYLFNKVLGFKQVAEAFNVYVAIGGALLLSFIMQSCVVSAFAYLMARRRGVEVLGRARDIGRIVKWMDRVHKGIGHFLPGLKIFKCSDEFWMDAVITMLQRCDAAIIDISDLNENMRWELQQCMLHVRDGRVIIAYRVEPDLFPDDPPDALVDEIREWIGADRLNDALFLPYPEPLPVVNNRPVVEDDLKWTVYATLNEVLGHALGRTLSAPET